MTEYETNWGLVAVLCAMLISVGLIGLGHGQVQLPQNQCDALGATKITFTQNYTFVCSYPFNATVPVGHRLMWIDTDVWNGHYHHTITSTEGLFDFTDSSVMDMMPSAFGVGVHPFYDKLNPTLTGNIIVTTGNESSVVLLDSTPQTSNSTNPQFETNSTNGNSTTNNNNTPLMLPQSQPIVQQPINSSASSQEVKTLSEKVDAINAKLDDIIAKQKQQSDLETSIFGLLNKILRALGVVA